MRASVGVVLLVENRGRVGVLGHGGGGGDGGDGGDGLGVSVFAFLQLFSFLQPSFFPNKHYMNMTK